MGMLKIVDQLNIWGGTGRMDGEYIKKRLLGNTHSCLVVRQKETKNQKVTTIKIKILSDIESLKNCDILNF